MKRIFLTCVILLTLIACSQTTEIIKENKSYTDPTITCFQEHLKSNKLFSDTYELDLDFPEMTIYTTSEFMILREADKETAIQEVGGNWIKCFPNDTRPLTLWVRDGHGNLITVVFVTRDIEFETTM